MRKSVLVFSILCQTALASASAPPVNLQQLRDPQFEEPIHEKPTGFSPFSRPGEKAFDEEQAHPRNRPRWIDAQIYALDLQTDPEKGLIGGQLTFTFSSQRKGLQSVVLDAYDMEITGVTTLAGASLPFLTGHDATKPQRMRAAYTFTQPEGVGESAASLPMRIAKE